MSEAAPRGEHPLALRLVVGALALGAFWVFLPLLPYLILAVWFASLVRPMHERLAHRLHGQRWAAGSLTLVLFLVTVAPGVFIIVVLTADAVALGRSILAAESGPGALTAIVTPSTGGATPSGAVSLPSLDAQSIWAFVQEHGQRAYTLLAGVADYAAKAVIGLVVFLASAYASLVHGPQASAWARAHTPLARRHQDRFVAAFVETGRGLVIGVGLTGIAQGLIATIGYLALGVPRALALGVLTAFASVVPTIGTAIVWVPVSIGLALDGQMTKAIIVFVVGALVVSNVDNVLHPALARWGKLDLHGFVVFLAMLGGIVAFGGWGLMLGPLVVRLALEGLRIFREEGLVEPLPASSVGTVGCATNPKEPIE